jgi:hypothetical protein
MMSFEGWPAHIQLYPVSHRKALGYASVQAALYPGIGRSPESTILYAHANIPINLDCFSADKIDISYSKWIQDTRLGNSDEHNRLVFRFYAYKDKQPFIAAPRDAVIATAHRHAQPNEYGLVLSPEDAPFIKSYTAIAFNEEADKYPLTDQDAEAFSDIIANLKNFETKM